jgi:hypothetical protein
MVLVAALAAAGTVGVFGQAAGNFSDVVAFEVGIADLHRAAQSGDDSAIPADKVLVIDAEIGAVTVAADDADGFIAEVEVIGGAWRNDDEIELYRAYAVFDGPEYREAFSKRSPTRLIPGKRILVIAAYLGIGLDYDGTTPVAIIQALALRRLQ